MNGAAKRVSDIRILNANGPWKTKSNGLLMVSLAVSLETIQRKFFHYNETELKKIPEDIRGFRIYTVRNLPKGQIGGTEFQRIREEIVFRLEGRVKWICEDLFGEKAEFVLTPEIGLWMPPFILHTYEATYENSGLLVLANTLFRPENSRTHDTYSMDIFKELQKNFKNHKKL